MFLEEHMKEARKVITRTLTKTLLASDLCDRGAELILESLCSRFVVQGTMTRIEAEYDSPICGRSKNPFVDFDTSINCIDRLSGDFILRRILVFCGRINLQGGVGLLLLGLSTGSEHLFVFSWSAIRFREISSRHHD